MSFPRFGILLVLVLAALLSTSRAAFAGNPNLYRYTTRDGLAGDYITAITLAPDGSAWIGTSEGATHIEKNRWTSYTRAHGLGDSFITAIAIGPDGKIWFGTQSGGVSVFDPIAKTILTYNLDNSEIPSNFVTTVAIDSKNRAWIGTLNKGIVLFEPSLDKWTRDLENSEINSFAWGDEETPWVLANGQIYFFDETRWVRKEFNGAGQVKRLYNASDNLSRALFAETENQVFANNGGEWVALPESDAAFASELFFLKRNQLIAFARAQDGVGAWLGTANGLYAVNTWLTLPLEKPRPVLLIHGWTVTGDDTLATSEFRFLKSYADRDGIPMYYARGISPKNTLFQNAAVIRDEIARVKQETGTDKVNIVAFSMGGMNARAYLESSLYANDVYRAIILGTPQAGVEIWKPILFQQILQKPDEPSAIELSPEYAQLVVNQTRSPNPNVLYDLLIGDAREQVGLDFLDDMPPSDALISVASALALDAPNVRKHVNADLHDWGPEPVPIDLTSYLYPRETWERYLRNALRNNDDAPIGSEVPPAPSERSGAGGEVQPQSTHTPVITKKIRAGETITNSVLVDENTSARFVAYYPGGKIDFSLVAPDGKKYAPGDLPRAENGVLTLSTDIASFSGYVVKNAAVGEWQMILTRTDAGKNVIDASMYVELNSPLQLEPSFSPVLGRVGEAQTIRAFFDISNISQDEPEHDVKITARVAQPFAEGAKAYTFSELELYDDGKHNDNAEGDGNYANTFVPARTGWYLVFVQLHGKNFVREQELAYPIVSSDAKLTSQVTVKMLDNEILVHTDVEMTHAGEYGVRAEVKRPNSDRIVARTFALLRLSAGVQQVSISIDVSQVPPGEYEVHLRLYNLDGAAYGLEPAMRAANFTR